MKTNQKKEPFNMLWIVFALIVLGLSSMILWQLGGKNKTTASWENPFLKVQLYLNQEFKNPIVLGKNHLVIDPTDHGFSLSESTRVLVGRTAQPGCFVYQSKDGAENTGPNGEIYYYAPAANASYVRLIQEIY